MLRMKLALLTQWKPVSNTLLFQFDDIILKSLLLLPLLNKAVKRQIISSFYAQGVRKTLSRNGFKLVHHRVI